jgi:hypothetical protein
MFLNGGKPTFDRSGLKSVLLTSISHSSSFPQILFISLVIMLAVLVPFRNSDTFIASWVNGSGGSHPKLTKQFEGNNGQIITIMMIGADHSHADGPKFTIWWILNCKRLTKSSVMVARSQSRKTLMTEYNWFEFRIRNGTYDFRVDETKMCGIPEFSEAWDIDDSEKAPGDDRHWQKRK